MLLAFKKSWYARIATESLMSFYSYQNQ